MAVTVRSSPLGVYLKRGSYSERVRAAYHLARFFQREVTSGSKALSRERLSCVAQGFYSDKLWLYEFATHGYDAYLADAQFIIGTGRINGKYRVLLNDKLAFHWLMGSSPETRVDLFAYVQTGRLNYPDNTARERLENHIGKGRSLVFKPIGGGGGRGVQVWSPTGLPKDAMPALLSVTRTLDNYLVTEHIRQARYARDIFPEAANTLRLLTMWDFVDHRPFLGGAAHRFATRKSQPTDNFSSGGLTASIDIRSGQLGAGASRDLAPDVRNRALSWSDTHPDTGAQIAGVTIPSWSELVESLLSIAAHLPYIRYVGWDVVVTDDGFRVLEANNAPDPRTIQIHRPLLLDERNREFYRRVGAT